MEIVYRGWAGIEGHKKTLAVVVRRDHDGQSEYEERAFGTTRQEIEHLAAYLGRQQVSAVVMESTAQYWRSVWHGLEAHFRLHLCHPLQARAPRGRRADGSEISGMGGGWWTGCAEATWWTVTFPEPSREVGAG